MKQFSFGKNKRLVSNRQFKAVLARNLRLADGLLTLYMAENDCGYPRLGVSVGKACGGAVVRNRLKRLLREAFRQSQDRISPSFDYVLMISPEHSKRLKHSANSKDPLTKLGFEHIKTSFLTLAETLAKRARKSVDNKQ